MAGMIDKFQKMPKWAQIAVAVVLVGTMAFLFAWFSFDLGKKEVEEKKTVYVDMPDAEEDNDSRSRLQAYNEDRYMNGSQNYWKSLEQQDGEASGDPVDDLSGYTQYERMLITSGKKTREEIDREHEEEDRAYKERMEFISGKGSPSGGITKPMTQAQQDSAYYDRMKKSLDIMTQYIPTGASAMTAAASAETAPPAEAGKEEEEQFRVIPLTETDAETGAAYISTDMDGDSIISSLDSPSDNGVVHYRGTVKSRPVKATFLKDEKIADGQRVILRLMEDMRLTNGTIIPANTHITGVCNFTRRLKIHVTMLHYGGRMFSTDISVYDNDGTEGIYCPLAEQANKKSKKAKEAVGGVLSSAGSVAATVFSGNPLLGTMMGNAASSAIRSATSSISSDGSITVNVSAGYQFYVFENVKEEGDADGRRYN